MSISSRYSPRLLCLDSVHGIFLSFKWLMLPTALGLVIRSATFVPFSCTSSDICVSFLHRPGRSCAFRSWNFAGSDVLPPPRPRPRQPAGIMKKALLCTNKSERRLLTGAGAPNY
ncbi:unnamed protein product [Pylaiella littoralis]